MIQFAEGSEAHYSVFQAIAERRYVVEIETKGNSMVSAWLVHSADDNGITAYFVYACGAIGQRAASISYDEINTITIL